MKTANFKLFLTLCFACLESHAIDQTELENESLWLRDQGGVDALHDTRMEDVPAQPSPRQVQSVTSPGHAIVAGERQQTRAQLLEEVNQGWMRPPWQEIHRQTVSSDQQNIIRTRLDKIFVPKVEFSELPLSQVVDALADLAQGKSGDANINIVLIDPDNRDPRVSIVLRRLSLMRILDFVVESVGFEYNLQEDAVVVRPRQGPGIGLETAFYPISRSTLIRLTGIHEENGLSDVDTIPDPFAPVNSRGEDVRLLSERSLKSFLQRAGIAFDDIAGADLALADGQLIVTQTARNHEKLTHLLRRYREVKQVEIEARFLEVEERNLEELGLNWTLVNADGSNAFTPSGRSLAGAFTIGQDESEIVIDRQGLDLPRIGQDAPVLPVTVDLAENAAEILSLSGSVNQMSLNVVLRALERQSGNDLLSAPKLTVLSGKTAQIIVAEEFRYPEKYGDTNAEVGRGDSNSGSAGVAITAGTPQSFTTRNVGVEMEVTPTVEEDDSISLRLKPKVTEFEGFVEYGGTSVAIASDTTVTVPSGFYQPIFSVREVNTEVTIWDGATVVMGGLTREHAVRVHDKVPVLGSLPVLGRFFQSEGESTQKRNLLIFVTANLVSPGGSPAFQLLGNAR